jgi:hypothetical protein
MRPLLILPVLERESVAILRHHLDAEPVLLLDAALPAGLAR